MYRGGSGGEACEDERELENVTETVSDVCQGPFFVLLGVLFFLSCQETSFCLVRSHFWGCLARSNEMSGRGKRVYRGKIALWDPKMPIKAGKSS